LKINWQESLDNEYLHFRFIAFRKPETRDKISGIASLVHYKYHHGYYDHPEREFRGFGMVEQIDSEHFEHWAKGDASNIVDATLHQEAGGFKNMDTYRRFSKQGENPQQFAHEYWYEEMSRQGFEVIHNEVPFTGCAHCS
jgi:hypothetical protein